MKTASKLVFTFLMITVMLSCSKDDPATPPDPPIIGTATIVDGQVSVTFTAPSNDGGSTITTYTATSTPDNVIGTLEQSESGAITVTGLTDSTDYTFTVTATNSIGTSIASSASNVIRIQNWYYNCYGVYDDWGYYLYDECYWEYY